MKLKICGIKDLKTLQFCDTHGVDYVGFVFAESRRHISPHAARTLLDKARLLRTQSVAVFKGQSVEDVATIIALVQPDWIQLHDPIIVDFPIERTLRATAWDSPSSITATDLLVDASTPGSGKPYDWDCLKAWSKGHRLWVAGGLNAENLPHLFSIIRPYAVDISSGAETGGIKDLNKIEQLIHLIKEENHDLSLPR